MTNQLREKVKNILRYDSNVVPVTGSHYLSDRNFELVIDNILALILQEKREMVAKIEKKISNGAIDKAAMFNPDVALDAVEEYLEQLKTELSDEEVEG